MTIFISIRERAAERKGGSGAYLARHGSLLAWAEESGLCRTRVSRILAMSTGGNRNVEEVQSYVEN